MAFPIKDVRFTTRRGDGGELLLYPRLLRDRSVLPKIDIAIQYFESMLGSERRELDPEALVHFFADHKLARCMVASLAHSYRYVPRELGQIVTRPAMRRLQRRGIDSPLRLRLMLFDRVNDARPGFLARADREAVVTGLEAELGLRRGELERLLYLDAEEHAILTRVGAPPRPSDIVAQYNLGVLQAMLRQSARVELALADGSPPVRAGIARLAAANDIDAELLGGSLLRVVLHGRQDALGGWTRHGRKLARTLIQILERGRALALEGRADVRIRDRRAHLRLTGELLDVLGGAPAPSIGWHEDASGDGQQPVERRLGGARGLRSGASAVDRIVGLPRSRRAGWRVRRGPDPRAWTVGLVVPDLLVQRGASRALICLVRSLAHAERLAPIAAAAESGEPLVFVGSEAVVAPLSSVGARTIVHSRPADGVELLAALDRVLVDAAVAA